MEPLGGSHREGRGKPVEKPGVCSFSQLCSFISCSLQLSLADEYAPEVSKAREQASERQKSAKNIKIAFLKKLNKILIGCLRLYVDNLLCMDLCGWSSSEAVKLLGDQVCVHVGVAWCSGALLCEQ